MANDTFKAALRQAGLTAEEFAPIIGVDPKTVQRGVAGSTPYPRHRATIARALDRPEHELWPDVVAPPVDDRSSARPQPIFDITGAWGQVNDAGAPNQVELLSADHDQVDL